MPVVSVRCRGGNVSLDSGERCLWKEHSVWMDECWSLPCGCEQESGWVTRQIYLFAYLFIACVVLKKQKQKPEKQKENTCHETFGVPH